MAFKINIKPSGVTFESSEIILDDAILQSVHLKHSCKNGQCGECEARIVSGTVENDLGERINQGNVLICRSKALTDLELEIDYYSELKHIKQKVYPCKVVSANYPTENVMILFLRLPPNSGFEYLPGQYIDLIYLGVKRSYSIANIKLENEFIELHIKRVLSGAMSDLIFGNLNENQLMRLEGPKGTFFLRNNQKKLILIATGTGIAPIKSIVESMIKNDDNREAYIYWGMRTIDDFYMPELVKLSQIRSNIHVYPVLSREEKIDYLHGYVQDSVIAMHKDLADFDVYACGSKVMINSAKQLFLQHGLAYSSFYSDAFVPNK